MLLGGEHFLVTVLAKLTQVGFLSGKDVTHGRFSGYVLNIAAGEGVVTAKDIGLFVGESSHHRLPDLATGACLGGVEFHLEDEAAGEGLVAEVPGKIGGGNQDTVQILNGVKADVLDGVHHLVHAVLGILHTLGEDGVGLVEKENRGILFLAAHTAVRVEYALDNLLGIANPLALELGHIHGKNVTAGAAGKLIYTCGLTAAGAPCEEDGKALAHSHLGETFLHVLEVGRFKERCQTIHLLSLALVVEKILRHDAGGGNQVLVLGVLSLFQSNLREESRSDFLGESKGISVLESFLAAKGDKAVLLDAGALVGDGTTDKLVVLHKLRKVENAVDGSAFVAEGNPAVAQIEEETLLAVVGVLHHPALLDLAAEEQVLVVIYQLLHQLKEAFGVDMVILVVGDEQAEPGEKSIGRQSSHRERLEGLVLLDSLQGFAGDKEEVAPATAGGMIDDTMPFHFFQSAVKANELNVGTAHEAGKVVGVATVVDVVFHDIRQQDSRIIGNTEGFGNRLEVFVQLFKDTFTQAAFVYGLIDVIEACSKAGEFDVPPEKDLFSLFSSSHNS